MPDIICIQSRTDGRLLYVGGSAADAHKAAVANLELKPRKTYLSMSEMTRLSQTEQYRQAYNGIDPLRWYTH